MVKYPRTYHLPYSEGATNDDVRLLNDNQFIGRKVVVTEKLDGENTTLYRNYFHARSLDGRHHPSQAWIKNFHASIKHLIPYDFRICGENMYARHSINYDKLETYFYVFNVWHNDTCLSWDDTKNFCYNIGLTLAPIMYEGMYHKFKFDITGKEGYVVRLASSFKFDDFNKSVAKFVRKNHVQTNEHWTKNWIKNGLK